MEQQIDVSLSLPSCLSKINFLKRIDEESEDLALRHDFWTGGGEMEAAGLRRKVLGAGKEEIGAGESAWRGHEGALKALPFPPHTPPQFLCGEHWTSPQRRARSRLTDHPSHWLSQQQLWPVSQSYMDESSHCPSSKTDISVAQTWPRNCTVWRNPIFPGIGQKGKPSEPIQTGTAWGQNTKIAPTQPPKIWLVSII